ncbi:hypothetical protein GCM10022261_26720 [Brevibacterium daeguense]|uniref:Energy transducer TonB n=1 Tax=Brevibacterium daeguense TaxID=909936 RepID=A0ABP8EMB8_9MICO
MNTPLTLSRPSPRHEIVRTPPHREPSRPVRRQADPSELLVATVRSLAVAVVEVLNGVRPAGSVARWIAPALRERIRTHAALRQDLARAVAPRTSTFAAGTPRLCAISENVVEAAVVVRSARRHRAVAMRLEHERGRWLITQFVTV